MILFQTFDLTVGKLMGTFGLCAIALFVGVNNFSRMEKGERIVQSFALTSLLANIVWLVLAVLFIWEVTPFLHEVPCQGWWHIGPCHDGLTTLGKIMVVAIDMTVMCFLISNVWSIAETVKPVKPLKITALICALYCGIYAMVITLGDARYMTDTRWSPLAGLMGSAFVVMACAALIVSRNGRKKSEEKTGVHGNSMSDAEVQAKIQEMVEKEVQARLAAQGNSTVNENSVEHEPVFRHEPTSGLDMAESEPMQESHPVEPEDGEGLAQ